MLYKPNLDFLPPLESDEFIPANSYWTIIGRVFLLVTFVVPATLASVVKYNVTIKAPATVRPQGDLQIVQASVGGMVKRIDVKENQVLKKDDVIATIDNSQLQIKKSQLQGNIQQKQLQLAQLDGQIRELDKQFTAESDRNNHVIASVEADLKRTQRDYQNRKITTLGEVQEAEANIEIAQYELQKARADLKSTQANTKAIEAALKSAIVKRDRYKVVAQSGSISMDQLEQAQLAVEQQQRNFESQQAALESQKQVIERQQQAVRAAIAKRKQVSAALNPTNAVISIAKEKIFQERATGQANLAQLNQEKKSLLQKKIEIQNQLNGERKELQQTETELKKSILRSPVDGIIMELNLRNPGQTVQIGDSIAQIAPLHASLIVKARVDAQDISKVQVCKVKKVSDCKEGKVQLRISAYPYPDYGTLSGAVRAIAPDAITSQNNLSPYYEVKIQPEKPYLVKSSRQYPIQYGMEVTADIIYREETVLSFLLRKARLLTDL